MGDEDDVIYYSSDNRERDHGNGVENYECDDCGMDTTFTAFHCGVCPRNRDRIREYNRKYVWYTGVKIFQAYDYLVYLIKQILTVVLKGNKHEKICSKLLQRIKQQLKRNCIKRDNKSSQ